jgi:hypothetical protein
MWCLSLSMTLFANHVGVPLYSQWVCNVFHLCDAACWLFWGVILLLGGMWCFSLGVILLIILWCHFTFSKYVMPFIGCDVAYWSFCGVILLLACMWYLTLYVMVLVNYFGCYLTLRRWCLPLSVMLPADHFGVLFHF